MYIYKEETIFTHYCLHTFPQTIIFAVENTAGKIRLFFGIVKKLSTFGV